MDVVEATGIPCTTYNDIEHNRSFPSSYNLMKLAIFFNRLWSEKFSKSSNYPMIDGIRIKYITVSVFLCGKDPLIDELDEEVRLIEEEFRSRELDYVYNYKGEDKWSRFKD